MSPSQLKTQFKSDKYSWQNQVDSADIWSVLDWPTLCTLSQTNRKQFSTIAFNIFICHCMFKCLLSLERRDWQLIGGKCTIWSPAILAIKMTKYRPIRGHFDTLIVMVTGSHLETFYFHLHILVTHLPPGTLGADLGFYLAPQLTLSSKFSRWLTFRFHFYVSRSPLWPGAHQ